MSAEIAALRELSEPWAPGDKVKVAIDRAARRAGLSYWRAFDIWYGKARRIEPFEITAIQEAVARKRKEETRNELHELRIRLSRLESLLVQTDPDFHRADAAAVSAQLRRMGGTRGGSDSAVD